MSTREKFEEHIKSTAWYQVLSAAANDDDEGASVFRMTRMAASEAWQASRAAALEEAAERVMKILGYPPSEYYAEAIRALAKDGGE